MIIEYQRVMGANRYCHSFKLIISSKFIEKLVHYHDIVVTLTAFVMDSWNTMNATKRAAPMKHNKG